MRKDGLTAEKNAATRAWLERGWNIEKRIRAKEMQLDDMRDKLYSLKASVPDGMPRGNRRGDWTRAADAVEDQMRELWRDIEALCATRREIKQAIGAVPDVEHRALLEYRYLCYKNWAEVADCMGFEERHIYRVHKRALSDVVIECQGGNAV